jgi:uncharacterized membrane-anchored protein
VHGAFDPEEKGRVAIMAEEGRPAGFKKPAIWPLPAAGATLTLVLAAMISYHEVQVARGEMLIVATSPVDPRDVLLGHFVQLAYEAEEPRRIDELVPPDEQAALLEHLRTARSPLVWALFRSEANDSFALFRISMTRPDDAPGAIAVRLPARVTGTGTISEGVQPDTEIAVDIPLDRFYADEKEALAIEAAASLRGDNGRALTDIRAILSISDHGKPRMAGLIVNGVVRRPGWF